MQHFNARCLPPLSEAEITRAMKRVFERGSEKERGWRVQESHLLQILPKADISSLVNPLPTLDDTHIPVVYPWRPFPTHLLPATVAQFVREVAKANCCNEASVALSALVALAVAIVKQSIAKPRTKMMLRQCPSGNVAAKLANRRQGHPENKPANLLILQGEAANLLNTSERSLRSAKKVQSAAVPEIVEAVESGKLAVSVAATQIDRSQVG